MSTWDGKDSLLDIEKKKDVNNALRKTDAERHDEFLDKAKVRHCSECRETDSECRETDSECRETDSECRETDSECRETDSECRETDSECRETDSECRETDSECRESDSECRETDSEKTDLSVLRHSHVQISIIIF